MMFHRASLSFVVVTMGLAVPLVAAAPASASPSGIAHRHQTTTTISQGSDPKGVFCSAIRALDQAAGQGLSSSAFEKDITSGHWPAAQKIILAALGDEIKVLKQFPNLLDSVPFKVRSALVHEIQAFPAEERSIEKDGSVAQFTSTSRSFGSTEDDIAAGKITDAYTIATCGSSAPGN